MIGAWQSKMIALCLAVALFGVVLMGAVVPTTDGPTRALLGLMGGTAPDLDAPMRFAVGLMGAVTFGWGLTMWAVASVSHALDAGIATTLWQRVSAAFAAWYVVDCAISIATGFSLNVGSNCVIAIAYVFIIRGSRVLRPLP